MADLCNAADPVALARSRGERIGSLEEVIPALLAPIDLQAINSRSFPPHYMIYAPGVSNADIGISRAALKDRFDLPFVYAGYSGGTRTGYIIVLAKEARDRTP